MRSPIHIPKFFLLAVVSPVLLYSQACVSFVDNGKNLDQESSSQARTFVFDCDQELQFVARVADQSAWLFLPTGTVETLQVSAQVYRKGGVLFQINGQEALLETANGKKLTCTNDRRRAIWEHAKLDGADFRAVGNEPGWYLEIRNQSKLVLVTDYGAARYEFDLPKPTTDSASKASRYEAHQDGHKISLMISANPCQDSMSDESFESTVDIVLNGEILHGCGRALH